MARDTTSYRCSRWRFLRSTWSSRDSRPPSKGMFAFKSTSSARSISRSTRHRSLRRAARDQFLAQPGIDSETAKKLQTAVKQSKLKVQASIQGDTVRVSGAKRDELQAAMALIRKEK